MSFKLLYAFVLFTSCIHFALSQCSVTIANGLSLREPVFLKQNAGRYELWSPNGAALTWTGGEGTTIACPGAGNSLTLNSQVMNTMTCNSGVNFNIGGVSVNAVDLICKTSIYGDTVSSGQACGNNLGQLITLGFNLGTSGFVTYIESCYNMNTASTLYTRHIIPGQSINYSIIDSTRPSFKTTGTAPHVSPATSYTTAQQKIRFTQLLGASQAAKYITTSSYLSRGHLSPDADGVYRSWAHTTYFYTNVAPQWQAFNGGNWVRVENAARNKAANLKQDVLIFTGTYGILSLPNESNTQIPLTLEANGIEVPKWYWKIIKAPHLNAAIVLIGLNNPFATSLVGNELLCPNICATTGWAMTQYTDFTKGYTYCCNVHDFAKAVSFVPNEALAADILTY